MQSLLKVHVLPKVPYDRHKYSTDQPYSKPILQPHKFEENLFIKLLCALIVYDAVLICSSVDFMCVMCVSEMLSNVPNG